MPRGERMRWVSKEEQPYRNHGGPSPGAGWLSEREVERTIRRVCGRWRDQKGSKYAIDLDEKGSLDVCTTRPSGEVIHTKGLIRIEWRSELGRVVWGKAGARFLYSIGKLDDKNLLWQSGAAAPFTWERTSPPSIVEPEKPKAPTKSLGRGGAASSSSSAPAPDKTKEKVVADKEKPAPVSYAAAAAAARGAELGERRAQLRKEFKEKRQQYESKSEAEARTDVDSNASGEEQRNAQADVCSQDEEEASEPERTPEAGRAKDRGAVEVSDPEATSVKMTLNLDPEPEEDADAKVDLTQDVAPEAKLEEENGEVADNTTEDGDPVSASELEGPNAVSMDARSESTEDCQPSDSQAEDRRLAAAAPSVPSVPSAEESPVEVEPENTPAHITAAHAAHHSALARRAAANLEVEARAAEEAAVPEDSGEQLLAALCERGADPSLLDFMAGQPPMLQENGSTGRLDSQVANFLALQHQYPTVQGAPTWGYHKPTQGDVVASSPWSFGEARHAPPSHWETPQTAADNAKPVVPEVQLIARQLEYYFSDSNLCHDSYLRNLMSEGEGWVSLILLVAFPRMRALNAEFWSVRQAVLSSPHLEVDRDMWYVRIRDRSRRDRWVAKSAMA